MLNATHVGVLTSVRASPIIPVQATNLRHALDLHTCARALPASRVPTSVFNANGSYWTAVPV